MSEGEVASAPAVELAATQSTPQETPHRRKPPGGVKVVFLPTPKHEREDEQSDEVSASAPLLQPRRFASSPESSTRNAPQSDEPSRQQQQQAAGYQPVPQRLPKPPLQAEVKQPPQHQQQQQQQQPQLDADDEKDEQDRLGTGKDELSGIKEVINPNSPWVRRWIYVLLIVAIYNAGVVPFRVSFDREKLSTRLDATLAFDLLADILCIADLVVNTRVAYFEDGALITSPKKILMHYLQGWFCVDFLSILPIDWFLLIAGYDALTTTTWRLNRLLQLGRLKRYMDALEQQPGISVSLVRLCKLLIYSMLLSHVVACAFFTFTLSEGFGADMWVMPEEMEERSQFSQYIYSLYWALATMTGNFDDVVPYTDGQLVFTLAVLLCGVLSFAYIIGNVGLATEEESAGLDVFRERLQYTGKFMRNQQLPMKLQARVLDYYMHWWNTTKGMRG